MIGVTYRYSYTVPACRQRMLLSPEVRARLDKLVLGLRMVPTMGAYDRDCGHWNANLGRDVRITYYIAAERREIVVLRVIPLARPKRSAAELVELGAR